MKSTTIAATIANVIALSLKECLPSPEPPGRKPRYWAATSSKNFAKATMPPPAWPQS